MYLWHDVDVCRLVKEKTDAGAFLSETVFFSANTHKNKNTYTTDEAGGYHIGELITGFGFVQKKKYISTVIMFITFAGFFFWKFDLFYDAFLYEYSESQRLTHELNYSWTGNLATKKKKKKKMADFWGFFLVIDDFFFWSPNITCPTNHIGIRVAKH